MTFYWARQDAALCLKIQTIGWYGIRLNTFFIAAEICSRCTKLFVKQTVWNWTIRISPQPVINFSNKQTETQPSFKVILLCNCLILNRRLFQKFIRYVTFVSTEQYIPTVFSRHVTLDFSVMLQPPLLQYIIIYLTSLRLRSDTFNGQIIIICFVYNSFIFASNNTPSIWFNRQLIKPFN